MEEAEAAEEEVEEEDEEEAAGEDSTSLPSPTTAPSLATALRVLAAEPPAVTAGDWGSSAARRAALSSTETRLEGRKVEREREST